MSFLVPPHILMCTVAKPCPSTMLCLCLISVCILSWTLLKIRKQISNWNTCKKVKWSSLLWGILGWLKAESEMVWLPSFSCLLEFSVHQKQPGCCYGCRTLQWSLFNWHQIVFTRWVHRTSLLFLCFSLFLLKIFELFLVLNSISTRRSRMTKWWFPKPFISSYRKLYELWTIQKNQGMQMKIIARDW